MDASKQKWSVKETSCFLALWLSAEVQNKLEGASRTKPVLIQIQLARTIQQLRSKSPDQTREEEERQQHRAAGISGEGRREVLAAQQGPE
ncbi:hypothetical protein ABVT39_002942 [Epinephelus coioides]